VLVVGGGEVAARQIDLLLRTSAKVRVVAPELVAGLAEKAAAGEIVHIAGEFAPEHLDGVRLAIAATDKRAINAWVARQAERRNIPVNVVDDRELSRFIVPAIVDRSPVVVAVGSSGDAPVLTRRLRERLGSFLPQRLGSLAKLAGKLRPTIKARNLPYNALHDRGFPSIGCAPCTRAVEPGADPRSGRWWWENPDSRECGLQPRRRVIPLKVEPRRTVAAAAAT
jgi:siroheme synthase-like protein